MNPHPVAVLLRFLLPAMQQLLQSKVMYCPARFDLTPSIYDDGLREVRDDEEATLRESTSPCSEMDERHGAVGMLTA